MNEWKVKYVGSGKGIELHFALKDGQSVFERGPVYTISNVVDFERLMKSGKFQDVTEYPANPVVAPAEAAVEEPIAEDSAVPASKKKGDK